MYDRLKKHGIEAGICVMHPYRGDHAVGAAPKEVRSILDRSQASLHWHVIGIGFWSEKSTEDQDHIYKSKRIVDCSLWRTLGDIRGSRQRMLRLLRYALGHAGWYGARGQVVTRYGSIPVEERDRAPAPTLCIEVPGETPIKRTKGEAEDWMRSELEQFASLVDENGRLEAKYEIPRSGNTGGSLYPWWHLSECRLIIDRAAQEPWEYELLLTIGACRLMRHNPNDPALPLIAEAIEELRKNRLPVKNSDGREGFQAAGAA